MKLYLRDGRLKIRTMKDEAQIVSRVKPAASALFEAVQIFGACEVGFTFDAEAGADPELEPSDRAIRARYVKRLFRPIGRFAFVAGRYRPCSWRGKVKPPKGSHCWGMSYAHLVDPEAPLLPDFSLTLCLCAAHARRARVREDKGEFDGQAVSAAHVGQSSPPWLSREAIEEFTRRKVPAHAGGLDYLLDPASKESEQSK
jgi:hypothetical protein